MLEIEMWPVDRPKDYPLNARTWSKKAIPKVRASLRTYGFRQPVVVDRDEVIIIGHLRRAAAREEGIAEIPVHIAKDLTPAQVRGLRLADNRTSDESTWNEDLLRLDFAGLKDFDFDLGLTGFDLGEIGKFTRGEARPDEDDVPAVQEAVVSRRGDLWSLSDHRLLCGDATSAEDVGRLMAGERAGLMNTDPPYGIDYDSAELHAHGVSMPRLSSDQLKDEVHQHFLEAAFIAALPALVPSAAWYLWHAMLTQGFFAAAAAAHVCLHRQIIWVKPVLVFGRGQYHWKHELCFMGRVEGHRPPDYGDHTQTTVWEVGRVSQAERDEFQHSTPKPVELFRIPILKHLRVGEIAYDPFAGTGPQFIAAEAESRRCYGLEIAPRYVDVIIRRFEKFSGKQAALGDGPYAGLTFDSVREGRLREAEDAIMEEALEAEAS